MRNAVVIGADTDLGSALARSLCRMVEGGTVHVTAPGPERAAAALRGGSPVLRPVALDVRDAAAVRALAERVGGADVVVSAASAHVVPGVRVQEQVRDLVAVNNHGAHHVLASFAPLLNDGGRLVVVTGGPCTLRHLPHPLRARFTSVSLPGLARVMDDYVTAVESGTAASEGWPGWIEVASRIGQVAAVKAAARDLPGGRDVLVNAVCPGGLPAGRATAGVLWPVALPPGTRTPHGELVRHRTVVPFEGES
ncbi:SDR family NAD(P)-dependent oxidoreductase [Spirillospora sp. NPDC127200]